MSLKVGVFPGKDMPLKRYKSYFPTLILEESKEDNLLVVLCHSKGIEKAMQYAQQNPHSKIIAMDPSTFPIGQKNFYVWARFGREIPEGVENLNIYQEQTHYPFQIKKIRDKMIDLIKSFTPE